MINERTMRTARGYSKAALISLALSIPIMKGAVSLDQELGKLEVPKPKTEVYREGSGFVVRRANQRGYDFDGDGNLDLQIQNYPYRLCAFNGAKPGSPNWNERLEREYDSLRSD